MEPARKAEPENVSCHLRYLKLVKNEKRMKFSQRISKSPIRQSMQIESIDDPLKKGIWNIIYLFFFDKLEYNVYNCTDTEKLFFQLLWQDFFKTTVDSLPRNTDAITKVVRDWYFAAEWFEIFDFLEWLCQFDDDHFNNFNNKVVNGFNSLLVREMSAYRIVDNVIIQITDEAEIKEIESAIENSKSTKLSIVSEHFKNALEKLADRKNPDFRNSIKESISAVESISKLISGDPKAELGQSLKIIEDRVGLHPALKKGFLSIYGYTSDQGGIRHALVEGDISHFEDAKYMLVACAAFVNYLKAKAIKAGLKLLYSNSTQTAAIRRLALRSPHMKINEKKNDKI